MNNHLEVLMAALEKAQSKGTFTLNEVSQVIGSYNAIARFVQENEQLEEEKKKKK